MKHHRRATFAVGLLTGAFILAGCSSSGKPTTHGSTTASTASTASTAISSGGSASSSSTSPSGPVTLSSTDPCQLAAAAPLAQLVGVALPHTQQTSGQLGIVPGTLHECFLSNQPFVGDGQAKPGSTAVGIGVLDSPTGLTANEFLKQHYTDISSEIGRPAYYSASPIATVAVFTNARQSLIVIAGFGISGGTASVPANRTLAIKIARALLGLGQ